MAPTVKSFGYSYSAPLKTSIGDLIHAKQKTADESYGSLSNLLSSSQVDESGDTNAPLAQLSDTEAASVSQSTGAPVTREQPIATQAQLGAMQQAQQQQGPPDFFEQTQTTTVRGKPGDAALLPTLDRVKLEQIAALKSQAKEQAAIAGEQRKLYESARAGALVEEALHKDREQALIRDEERFQKEIADTDKSIKEIDPDRIWRRQSTGQKVVGVIAAMAGAFLEGFTRGQIQNAATRIADQAVERDIQAQLQDVRNAKDKKQFLATQLGAIAQERQNIPVAIAQMKAAKYADVLQGMKQVELNARANPEMSSELQLAIADLEKKYAIARDEIMQSRQAQSQTTTTKIPAAKFAGKAGEQGKTTSQAANIFQASSSAAKEIYNLSQAEKSLSAGDKIAEGIYTVAKGTGISSLLPSSMGSAQAQRGVAVEHIASADRAGGVPTPDSMLKREATMPSIFSLSSETNRKQYIHLLDEQIDKIKSAMKAEPTAENLSVGMQNIKSIEQMKQNITLGGGSH